MAFTRIIPTLLLKDERLVKTINFKNAKYVGDPLNAVKIFNEKEVDELVLLDITATRKRKDPNYSLIKDIASECFMPLSYGGGIRNLEQIQLLMRCGVEKIILNQAILHNPELVEMAVKSFGSSTIVASIDVKKNLFGKNRIFDHSVTKTTKKDPIGFVKIVTDLGVGELLVTSVDQEGTMLGYDFELIKSIESIIDIPLIACGGAGTLDDIQKLFSETHASAAAGSLFVYFGKHRAVLINYPNSQELNRVLRS